MFDRSAAVERALQHLRDAREDLKDAGATRAADKVRAAIKSTEGALRHADRMEREEMRARPLPPARPDGCTCKACETVRSYRLPS